MNEQATKQNQSLPMQQPTAEEFAALQRENRFLQLRVKSLRRARDKYRDSRNELRKTFIPAIGEAFNAPDGSTCERGVNVSQYAKHRGMCTTYLIDRLVDAGIVYRKDQVLYLCDPSVHGNLVYYRIFRATLSKGGRIERPVLCWNEAGVAFLDEFIRTHYKNQPKREFSFD